ncbi:MAG: hypothetical protein K8R59_18090, partial [Thermoanaerobaculales bacterium]|nr:hypothetical protein [Thermoanaerobaculales bacterium]
LEDGRVIVYDFGCVKEVPEFISHGYAALMSAVLEGRPGEVPGILQKMGIETTAGGTMPVEISDAYAQVLSRIVREEPPYTFGEDDFFQEMMELGRKYWSEAANMTFPSDLVFVNRSFGGHVGNLGRLRATGPWREMIAGYACSAS